MNVAIYSRKLNKQNAHHYTELLGILKDFGWNPIIEKDLNDQLIKRAGISDKFDVFSTREDLKTGIDLAFSIGGDGTFIQTVSYIRDSGVPVLGINTGRLGFLANISTDQLHETMDLVREKKYEFQKRSLLRVETESGLFGDENIALNEVSLHKKDTASMITVHASLDDKYLNSYWADGLIVGTPTGSTAYNLSCGGPIVTPGCQIHLLTPIAPHNLNVRPMVVPDHLPIKLSVEGRERRYLISIDGKSLSIPQGEEVLVKKAEFMINVIKFQDNNFLDTIRNKMLWGIDKRN
ncbi:MAG: NAD kinase [Flavobacteriia bacterium]|nr:NAD kinase [Flavobacteriia bacterium]